ncbi:MAG TPA: class I SAM-dependent methyltransferase [Candidatus Paceibacterota bacterium]|nr:class I SAM-dependent methyltransferase [Candidatus Paceibacterota bacterium]
MDDSEQTTQDTYNRIATEWAREHDTPDYWQIEFDIFSKLLPKGKVLDVGCGAARDYPLFHKGGYDYTGIDYSEGLLREAKKKFPDARLERADILRLSFENDFDGFWAVASLLHIPKAKMRLALENVKRAIKPGGIGMVVLKKGQGEKMEQDQRFFAYWEKEEFEEVLARAGFRMLYFVERPVSERTTWLAFYVTL